MVAPRISKKKKLALGLAAAWCACSAGLLIAHNTFADFNRGYTIGRAASILVTPRGQEYFSQHELMGILERNKIDLTHQELDRFAYDAPSAFDLNHLPAGLKPYQGTLNSLRGTLRDWLIGFDLKNPVFHAKAREAGYEASGLDVGLYVDAALTETWRQQGGNGVAVIVEATIPHLRVGAKDICGYDSANPMLGNCALNDVQFAAQCGRQHSDQPKNWCTSTPAGLQALMETCRAGHGKDPDWCDRYSSGFGVYHPWIELRDKDPLRVSIPTYIQIQPDGSIEFNAVTVKTNLDQLNFASGQDRNLLLPYVQLQVGTRTTTLNTGPLVSELYQKEHELVQLGIHHLQDFVVQELPGRLSNMAFDRLKQGFSLVETISPPGVDVFHDKSMFEWGLRPSALNLISGFLSLDLAGYVVDPDLTWDEHLPNVAAPRPPKLAGRDASTYDFAFAINSFVAQRVIWLAYNRGALQPVTFTDKDGITLSAKIIVPPTLSNGTGGKARLHVYLQFDRDGSVSEWWALANPFVVELYLDVKLQLAIGPTASPNSFDLVVDHIDTNQSTIEDRYIDHAKDSVMKTLREDLESFNKTNPANPRKLTDTPISLPDSVFNLPINLVQTEFDPNGYLVLYMNYGDRAQ